MSEFAGLPEEPELPEQLQARRRRPLSTGLCVFLLAVGAVLLFALRSGTTFLRLNLHVVGVILILTGLLGLLLPRIPGATAYPDRLRRWIIPSGTTGYGAGPPGGFADGYGERQPMVEDSSLKPGGPTLADEVLSMEQDPPL